LTTRKWEEFYAHPISMREYISNICMHKEFFLSILDEQPQNALEVGLGSATMAAFLSHLGVNVTAVDNNATVLSRAEETCRALKVNVRLQKMDAFKLEFDRRSFDVVYHQGLLEHFTDDKIRTLLREQLRVGQVVVFSVPCQTYGRRDIGDERLLTKDEWEEILSSFRVVQTQYYGDNILRRGGWPHRSCFLLRQVMYLAKIRGE